MDVIPLLLVCLIVSLMILVDLFHIFGHWIVACRVFGSDKVHFHIRCASIDKGENRKDIHDHYVKLIENRKSLFLSGVVASFVSAMVCWSFVYTVISIASDSFRFSSFVLFLLLGVFHAVVISFDDIIQYRHHSPSYFRGYVEKRKKGGLLEPMELIEIEEIESIVKDGELDE